MNANVKSGYDAIALRFEVEGFGVQVVVVQPGLIRTGFAEAVSANLRPEEGPYAAFDAAVAAAKALEPDDPRGTALAALTWGAVLVATA